MNKQIYANKYFNLISYMEQRPSREVDSHSTCSEIPHLLWNKTFHYSVHKKHVLVPITYQKNRVRTVDPIFRIPIPSTLLSPKLPLPLGFVAKNLHVFLIFLMRATSVARRPQWFDHTNNFGENYIDWSFPFAVLSIFYFYVLDPNTVLSTLFSDICKLSSLSVRE
jgi:hypothetical protein